MASLLSNTGALSAACGKGSDGRFVSSRNSLPFKDVETAKLICNPSVRLALPRKPHRPLSAPCSTSSTPSSRTSVRVNCGLLQELERKTSSNRRKEYLVETAGVMQMNSVTKFFVDAFFLDGQEIRMGSRRQLEGGQGADIRSRYNGSNAEAAMLFTRDPEKGSIVGCVGLEVARFDGRKQISPYAYSSGVPLQLRPVIANLAVARNYRRQGIAKLLMQECEDRCRGWGYDEMLLFVESDNRKARRLYSDMGYRKQWTIKSGNSIKLVDGRLKDVPTTLLCLRKSLKPGLLGWLGL